MFSLYSPRLLVTTIQGMRHFSQLPPTNTDPSDLPPTDTIPPRPRNSVPGKTESHKSNRYWPLEGETKWLSRAQCGDDDDIQKRRSSCVLPSTTIYISHQLIVTPSYIPIFSPLMLCECCKFTLLKLHKLLKVFIPVARTSIDILQKMSIALIENSSITLQYCSTMSLLHKHKKALIDTEIKL